MFDALIHTSLRQRLIVLVLSLLLVLYGGLTLRELPIDVFPDLNRPSVTLMTEAGGMAPEEVEQAVTLPVEAAMNGLPGVSRVRSVSGIGLSVIYVEFGWGTDLYRNRQQVSERLIGLKEQLPPGVQPQLGPVASIMGEILLIALPADPARANPMQAREYADAVLRPPLMALPGVAQVTVMGGGLRQYRVEMNTVQMRALGISREALVAALQDFGANGSGGFLEENGREVLIRQIGRCQGGLASAGAPAGAPAGASAAQPPASGCVQALQNLAVGSRQGQPILLKQVAELRLAPAPARGSASYQGQPAVMLSVQKQPGADSVRVTRAVEQALASLAPARPAGLEAPRFLFRQADFIAHSVANVAEALRDGALLVAVVLFMFLLNVRTTLISLAAIPVSLLVTALVFQALGMTINTMTLGGLAIAIGELVDDAVVGVENVLRRLRLNQALATPRPALAVIAEATLEVRSAIVYATLIIVLVFVPLFALPGIEGRLFTPLGVAYIVSILASMVVSVTLTPVLAAYLLPAWLARQAQKDETSEGRQGGERPKIQGRQGRHESPQSPLVRALQRLTLRGLDAAWGHSRALLLAAGLAVALAAASLAWLPRAFLPPFNEGSLTVNLLLNPGSSLAESDRIGTQAELLIASLPEVAQVGRRTGRAEQDEHAEGVHYSELDVDLKPGPEADGPLARLAQFFSPSERSRAELLAELRSRLAQLPAVSSVGQPISHRLDHLLSGVRSQIALKIYGEDLDTLRGLAAGLQTRLARLPGLTDLQIEKQVLIPQLKIRVNEEEASRLGVAPGPLLHALGPWLEGERISQITEGRQRFDLVLRLPEAERSASALAGLLIDTPAGPVPLARLATLEDGEGPNQISRENGQRRIVIAANTDGRDLAGLVAAIRAELAAQPLPEGYTAALEGQFQAQEEAAQRMALLACISLLLIFLVLYSRWRSVALVAIIMASIPMALVGSVAALWLSGQPLSVAALVGFITLTGIATRNGILKISHYLHLCAHEGEQFGQAMILRGTLERLTPVWMTALVAALALLPLLLSPQAPGKELLHPVAVVIFGGLISATLLDTLLTPLMFWRWGGTALQRLLAQPGEPGARADSSAA